MPKKKRRVFHSWLGAILAGALLAFVPLPTYSDSLSCAPNWYAANLTNYTSHPDPGSEECVAYNGCAWAGQFYGLNGTYDENWVARHNIVAVHSKDWDWLGMKVLQLRQGNKELTVQAIDACADADCAGCCTDNLGGDGYLIDIEKYTMSRFGAGDGTVEFRICE